MLNNFNWIETNCRRNSMIYGREVKEQPLPHPSIHTLIKRKPEINQKNQSTVRICVKLSNSQRGLLLKIKHMSIFFSFSPFRSSFLWNMKFFFYSCSSKFGTAKIRSNAIHKSALNVWFNGILPFGSWWWTLNGLCNSICMELNRTMSTYYLMLNAC